jgi:Sortase domain
VREPRVRHLVLVVAGVVLVGSGLALTQREPRADAPDLGRPVAAAAATTAAPTAARVPAPAPAPTPPGQATPAGATPELPGPAAPVSLLLPGGPAPVPLQPIGALRSGVLALPDRPSVLGWYAAGALPGDDAGTAVVAGHVDSARYGVGPLRRLLDLSLGDRIEVTDEAGTVHLFAVTSRTTYRKADLPRALFRTDGPPQLALITCGGPFDRSTGNYEDNVVVVAAAIPTGTPGGAVGDARAQ